MKFFPVILCLCLLLIPFSPCSVFADKANEKCGLTIGVSLHPYYSWVSHIVGDTARVVPLIPSEADPHSYQPLPRDIERLKKLDLVVINGLGHDEFVSSMLKAADNPRLRVIDTNKGLPLISVFTKKYAFEGGGRQQSFNSHTYISINGAARQIRMISRELEKRCPAQAALFKKNTRAYTSSLQKMLARALEELAKVDMGKLRIATVHDGYAYLFQELGIKVSAVVQPRHGIKPSPRQLEDTIRRIKKAGVGVLFAELDYEKKYVDIIFQETGCRIYKLSHVSRGKYERDYFERAMRRNLETIVRALTEVGHGG